jgi:hypothetical protein
MDEGEELGVAYASRTHLFGTWGLLYFEKEDLMLPKLGVMVGRGAEL